MGVGRTSKKTTKSSTKPAAKKPARATAHKAATPKVAAAVAVVEAPVATMTMTSAEPVFTAPAPVRRPPPKHAAVMVERSAMEDWPPQAELVLSAIEAGQHCTGPGVERRRGKRASFRVRAQLRLYSDNPGEPGRAIYTRDIHSRGLGFITPHRLPLGHGGLVDLPTPAGKIVSVPCTLLRCREAAPGWYEGSVYFNRDQHGLVPRSAG
jgi:hypothetical protein